MKTCLKPLAAMIVSTVASLTSPAAVAQYVATAERCQFVSAQSTYGNSRGVRNGGPLFIEWSPQTGELFQYRWYYNPYGAPNASPESHPLYSEYIGEQPAHVTGKTVERSSLLLDARVMSKFNGVRTNAIHGRLFNGYGSYPIWNFAGILEQTGSGWIGASGEVTCGPR